MNDSRLKVLERAACALFSTFTDAFRFNPSEEAAARANSANKAEQVAYLLKTFFARNPTPSVDDLSQALLRWKHQELLAKFNLLHLAAPNNMSAAWFLSQPVSRDDLLCFVPPAPACAPTPKSFTASSAPISMAAPLKKLDTLPYYTLKDAAMEDFDGFCKAFGVTDKALLNAKMSSDRPGEQIEKLLETFFSTGATVARLAENVRKWNKEEMLIQFSLLNNSGEITASNESARAFCNKV
jgi:hypothetical protein